MYSQLFCTTIQRVRAEIVFILGSETHYRPRDFTIQNLCSRKMPSAKKSVSSTEVTQEFVTNTGHFPEVFFDESHKKNKPETTIQ